MTNDATSARPTTTQAAPRFSQSVHLLMDEPTRAAVMGLAVLAAREVGRNVRPREGETLRGLVESALDKIRQEAPALHDKALIAGRQELAARAAVAQTRSK